MGTPILIAEDNLVSNKVLANQLRGWNYDVISTADGQRALEILADPEGPRIALLDWEMPSMDGVAVCRTIRGIQGLPFRYLIVLTGRDCEADIVAALESGADDFISKPWTPGVLKARLGVGERILALHAELEVRNRELLLTSQTDHLTRIWNRANILGRLEEELERAGRAGFALSVLMLDVDHFKKVNDTYGHAAGDQVLIEVARRLSAACRKYDAIGRYGGEEFLAVVSQSTREEAECLAERFRAIIESTPVQFGNLAISVTASIGIACLPGGCSAEMNSLINAADMMLYRAKSNGRNRVETTEYCPEPANVEAAND